MTDGLSLPHSHSHSLARRVSTNTPPSQTHSAPSPRPTRRPSAPAAPSTTPSPSGGGGGGRGSSSGHHHHHHRHTGPCSHHHHHHHHHQHGETTNGEAAGGGGSRRVRRSSQSSQGSSSLSYTRPYKQQMSKQRSFDVSNYPKRSELNLDRPREIALSRSYSFMSRPRCHDEDGMHERFLMAGGGSGLRSVESTPQPRRRHKPEATGSPDSSLGSHGYLNHRQRSDSSGLESLATPMMHRKQRSLESGKARPRAPELRPSSSAHTRLVASDSSPSPPSPKHEFSPFTFESPRGQDSGASTLTDKDTRSNYGRGSADSSPHSQVDSGLVSGTTGSRGSIDSTSRRTADRPDREAAKTTVPAEAQAKVSPSRPASEREGRRCSHRRHHHCSKHRTATTTATPALPATTDSDRSDTLQSSSSSQHLVQAGSGSGSGANSHNHNSSSGSSSTAKQASPSSSKQASPSTTAASTAATTTTTTTTTAQARQASSPQHRDLTHLYSNLDYVYEQPVYQYIMEQAKLTGYRLGDPLYEDGDSLHSDDSGGRHDDSDEFADDEGMSNADSSSQEYLEDVNYLADDEMYAEFYMPFSWRNKTKLDDEDVTDTTKEGLAPPPSHVGPGGTAHPPQAVPRVTLPCNIPSATQHIPLPPSSLPLDTQHASLRRKKDAANHQPLYSPIQEKGELAGGVGSGGGGGGGGGQLGNRPLSISIPNMTDPTLTTNPVTGSLHRPSQGLTALSLMKKPPSESDFERYSGGGGPGGQGGPGGGEGHNMEKYAQENLNIHTRGLLRKKVPVMDMISWTKDLIRKPMLATLDKSLKNQACELFRLVQIYMSDRKPKPGMTLNSVGLDLVNTCFNTDGLRDELFVQICRQTTENHKRDSLRRGWELLAICLAFFPPSDKFNPYLAGYISRHCDPAFCAKFPDVSKWPIHIQVAHYAGVCMKRLERTTVNGKRQRLKKPTLEEIDLARLHIFRASMFGGTIEEVMALQRDRYPHRRLPWVQTTLSEEVLRLQGTNTEGIFRVPADFEEVHQLKQVVDQWEVGECGEAHVCAALLKLWYRELYEPLIPDSLYQAAINAHDDPQQAVALVNSLPEINRLVLSYLIRFLQYFAQPEIVAATKMDASNLAMVMAPNCLRCTSDDPRVIYENTRKEMAFIRTLIQNLDTAFMEGVV